MQKVWEPLIYINDTYVIHLKALYGSGGYGTHA
jgi:hypothetical protein